jgi:hypothetical protein
MKRRRREKGVMMRLPLPVRALPMLPLALVLAGCWMSEHALIGPAQASRLPIEGTYRSPDPAETERLRIVAARDGGYLFEDGKESQRVYLAGLGKGWAIVQSPLGKSGDERLYTLIELGADRLTMHDAPCDAGFDGIAGMEREETTCTFESFAALEQAARRAVGLIESGKVKEEPAVMLRQ